MPKHEKGEPQDLQPWQVSRRRFLRNTGLAAATIPLLGGLTEVLSQVPADASVRDAVRITKANDLLAEGAVFASHPTYTFNFVNHVTTNPFFVPTQYGAADACALLGCKYQWTGSTNSIVGDMVSAMNTAIAGRVSGISVPVIDPTAFIKPTDAAIDADIPVLSYNANPPASTASDNHQLCYIGQDLFQAGVEAGQRILPYVKKGDLVGGMIATPGSLNIQPRIDGAKSVLKPAGIDFVEVATGALLSDEFASVPSWYLGHKDVKFMYAVDDGTGEAVAKTIAKYNLVGKVQGSGWDIAVPELQAVKSGALAFSIDQQAYLQGFLPVLYLFLFTITGGLMRPSDTDTGLYFITKDNVGPYLAAPSRVEGSTAAQKVLPKATVSILKADAGVS
jgi:simple sugar transport system substrate-binding protein